MVTDIVDLPFRCVIDWKFFFVLLLVFAGMPTPHPRERDDPLPSLWAGLDYLLLKTKARGEGRPAYRSRRFCGPLAAARWPGSHAPAGCSAEREGAP